MKQAKYENEMTMTMTNVLLNINAYSAQLNIHSNSFCAKKNHIRSRVQIYVRRL